MSQPLKFYQKESEWKYKRSACRVTAANITENLVLMYSKLSKAQNPDRQDKWVRQLLHIASLYKTGHLCTI